MREVYERVGVLPRWSSTQAGDFIPGVRRATPGGATTLSCIGLRVADNLLAVTGIGKPAGRTRTPTHTRGFANHHQISSWRNPRDKRTSGQRKGWNRSDILAEHDAMTIWCLNVHFPHTPGFVLGCSNIQTACRDLRVVGIDIFKQDLGEILMIAEITGRDGVGTFADHLQEPVYTQEDSAIGLIHISMPMTSTHQSAIALISGTART